MVILQYFVKYKKPTPVLHKKYITFLKKLFHLKKLCLVQNYEKCDLILAIEKFICKW